MPTSTTNTYEISLRLLENTPFAVAVNFDNRCQVKPPVLMRGVPSILRIKLFKYSGLVKAAELSALYTGFRLVIANDFDDTTAPLLVSDENGATVDAQNDCIVLPISEMNTVNLEALIGTRERLDLGAELQLFKPSIQDEPIEAWQFPVGVQNRRDLTGTATPAPGSVNYYRKDEVYNKQETDAAIAAAGGTPTLVLESAPTTFTEGEVGQRALVSTTGDTYICTAIDDTDPTAVEYTWKKVANESDLDVKISTAEKGVADGVAGLDGNGKVPPEQLPETTSGALGGVRCLNVSNGNIYGVYHPVGGRLQLRPTPLSYIDQRTNQCAICPPQLNYAVTAALTDENRITLTAAQQQTARGVLGIDGTTSITALTGGSGTVEPGKVYTLTMTTDFTLSASSVASGIYGESVLFVVPNTYAFSVASGITLDAEMIAGLRYRLLISWTPFGVHAEQTAEWEA